MKADSGLEAVRQDRRESWRLKNERTTGPAHRFFIIPTMREERIVKI
jgi:hypothetical protein